jgi:LmbE family N-acetylglucosaminyl deacetylase
MKSESLMRGQFRRLCTRILESAAIETERELCESAIVFAPHPDDETLGCGGTIIKKKQQGADVKIVFMTDGRGSHGKLMSEQHLKEIRTDEAVAAARNLGVNESDVTFLNFEEGRLVRHLEPAVQLVAQLIDTYRPAQIFVPYWRESLKDHSVTNRIVSEALYRTGLHVAKYEYPIWFWHQWPWVNEALPWVRKEPSHYRARLGALRKDVVSILALLRDFRCSVYIGDVLGQKREALNQHKSQMTRLASNPSWATLGDVANGDFLDCFFRPYEIFVRQGL